MKYVVLFLFILITFSLQAQDAKVMTEQQKIDYLINRIEKLEGARFIRNGVSYDATAAAAHLRMKREKGGRAIKTVNDFIDKVASSSSMSGKPYLIKFNDGKEMEARDFYLKCLGELKSVSGKN